MIFLTQVPFTYPPLYFVFPQVLPIMENSQRTRSTHKITAFDEKYKYLRKCHHESKNVSNIAELLEKRYMYTGDLIHIRIGFMFGDFKLVAH